MAIESLSLHFGSPRLFEVLRERNNPLIKNTIKQAARSNNCAQKGHLRDSRKKQRPMSRGEAVSRENDTQWIGRM